MSETWSKEFCPVCQAKNWINRGDSGNVYKMDIAYYDCWKCKAEIHLVSGEDGDDYDHPHVHGAEAWDDEDRGNSVDGKERPD